MFFKRDIHAEIIREMMVVYHRQFGEMPRAWYLPEERWNEAYAKFLEVFHDADPYFKGQVAHECEKYGAKMVLARVPVYMTYDSVAGPNRINSLPANPIPDEPEPKRLSEYTVEDWVHAVVCVAIIGVFLWWMVA